MRKFICAGMIASLAHAQVYQQQEDGAEEIIQGSVDFIIGLLEGISTHEHLDGMKACINDSQPLTQAVVTMVEDFEKESFSGIVDGVKQMGTVFGAVKNMISDCKSIADTDAAKINAMADAFRHPGDLFWEAGKHLWYDGKDIWSHIHSGINDIVGDRWESAGQNFGVAGAIVVWGENYVETVATMRALNKSILRKA